MPIAAFGNHGDRYAPDRCAHPFRAEYPRDRRHRPTPLLAVGGIIFDDATTSQGINGFGFLEAFQLVE